MVEDDQNPNFGVQTVPALESWRPPKYKHKAPGQEVTGTKPPEAETLLAFGRSLKVTNFPHFKKTETQKRGLCPRDLLTRGLMLVFGGPPTL